MERWSLWALVARNRQEEEEEERQQHEEYQQQCATKKPEDNIKQVNKNTYFYHPKEVLKLF